jgi:hypothetical protein
VPEVNHLAKLAMALELPANALMVAIAATKEKMRMGERPTKSEAFEPHGFLIGSKNRPSQIVIFGMTGGGERWLKIPLDLSNPPITYARQALAVVRKTPLVPFHGNTAGFVVNYTESRAVVFDLEGDPVKMFSESYYPGAVRMKIGSKTVSAERLAHMLGAFNE